MTAGTLPQVNLCIHCKSKPLWESIEVHARHGTKPCTLKDSYVKQNYLEFGIPYLPHFLARDAKPERLRGYLERINSPLLPFKFDDGECVVVEDYDSEFWDDYEPEYFQDDAIRDLEKTRWGPIERAAVWVVTHRSPVTGVVKYYREVSCLVTETEMEQSKDVPYIVSRGPRETEMACVSTSRCYQAQECLVDSSELVLEFRETNPEPGVCNARVTERKPSRVSGWYRRFRFRRTDSWKG